jgi:methionyl aminopeptidase
MITIKNKLALSKMEKAGKELAAIFDKLPSILKKGKTSAEIDAWIESAIKERGLVSMMKGYRGYRHVSCISVNDVVVHGVPSGKVVFKEGDLVKVDVCVSWKGYCADMARGFLIEPVAEPVKRLSAVAMAALDKGIAKARAGGRLSDISSAVQKEVEAAGYGVVRIFAGHGIGKNMHEDPEILNYGAPGKGPVLRAGMTFAIEPMITMGKYDVYVENDGWTARTSDKTVAAHVEDTVLITENEPQILTRPR